MSARFAPIGVIVQSAAEESGIWQRLPGGRLATATIALDAGAAELAVA